MTTYRVHRRDGTVQEIEVFYSPPPAVWAIREWDGPLPLHFDDPLPRCRKVVLRRQQIRYPNGRALTVYVEDGAPWHERW
jgi:hypothetical protein